MRLRALVEWTPTAGNREADALANGDTTLFDPALEVKIDDQVLKWLILPEMLAMGKEADETFQAAKKRSELPDRSRKLRKRRLEDRLKLADPWSYRHGRRPQPFGT